MLGIFRERSEPLLRATGVRFAWHVEEVPLVQGLDASVTLHVLRILQEAVSNALRHSGTDVIEVHAAAGPPGFAARVEVRDRGHGIRPSSTGGNHGLTNMRARAAAIGARLTVHSDAGGTTVTVDLPQTARQR
jgi:signal transduction histidine kinase